jgi:7-carboxy-7-deazaguanine synthase
MNILLCTLGASWAVIKEIFYSLQGEGTNAGRAAVFCRFAGCNLWSGRSADRATATCSFCDTDFVGTNGPGGGCFDAASTLAAAAKALWPPGGARPLVICTGGEPALQLDDALVEAFHALGFEVAIETNGTRPLPAALDHVCVSPKAGYSLVLIRGNELKLVYPQQGADPGVYEALEFDIFYLQPMDGQYRARNTAMAVDYCRAHPQWRLSAQIHKLVGIP